MHPADVASNPSRDPHFAQPLAAAGKFRVGSPLSHWAGRGVPGGVQPVGTNTVAGRLGRVLAAEQIGREFENDQGNGGSEKAAAPEQNVAEKQSRPELPELMETVTCAINLHLDMEEAMGRLECDALRRQRRRCEQLRSGQHRCRRRRRRLLPQTVHASRCASPLFSNRATTC